MVLNLAAGPNGNRSRGCLPKINLGPRPKRPTAHSTFSHRRISSTNLDQRPNSQWMGLLFSLCAPPSWALFGPWYAWCSSRPSWWMAEHASRRNKNTSRIPVTLETILSSPMSFSATQWRRLWNEPRGRHVRQWRWWRAVLPVQDYGSLPSLFLPYILSPPPLT
jgi:hypothetical protein